MMKLEQAKQRCFDRANLEGESVDLYGLMYRYKAIASLPESEFDAVYDELSERLGFQQRG